MDNNSAILRLAISNSNGILAITLFGLNSISLPLTIINSPVEVSLTTTELLEELQSVNLCFDVGGLIIPQNEQKKEHVDWLEEILTIGDTITIKIVSNKRIDEPKSRRYQDPSIDCITRENRRKNYEQMKQEFEKGNSES